MYWRIFLMVRQEQLPGGSGGGQEVAHVIHRMLGASCSHFSFILGVSSSRGQVLLLAQSEISAG
jgi:hypothetical protein